MENTGYVSGINGQFDLPTQDRREDNKTTVSDCHIHDLNKQKTTRLEASQQFNDSLEDSKRDLGVTNQSKEDVEFLKLETSDRLKGDTKEFSFLESNGLSNNATDNLSKVKSSAHSKDYSGANTHVVACGQSDLHEESMNNNNVVIGNAAQQNHVVPCPSPQTKCDTAVTVQDGRPDDGCCHCSGTGPCRKTTVKHEYWMRSKSWLMLGSSVMLVLWASVFFTLLGLGVI